MAICRETTKRAEGRLPLASTHRRRGKLGARFCLCYQLKGPDFLYHLCDTCQIFVLILESFHEIHLLYIFFFLNKNICEITSLVF